jgi:hypothetical protein
MRVDQFLKLQALSEKLADVVITDVDPVSWAGAGLTAAQMTQTQRGDAFWSRKMALSTISVLVRVQGLIHSTQQFGDTPPPAGAPAADPVDEPPSLEAEIAQAEKDARVVLDRVMSGGKP